MRKKIFFIKFVKSMRLRVNFLQHFWLVVMLKSLSDMLDISVHIALEDCVKGSKQAHEAFPINRSDLDFSLGDDVGSSGFAQKESSFAEVVTGAV